MRKFLIGIFKILAIVHILCFIAGNRVLGGIFSKRQNVSAKGRLLCGAKPAAGIPVKLYDEDDGLDPDDLMGQTLTDEFGRFSVSGGEWEMTPIDPILKITHNCSDVDTMQTAFGLVVFPSIFLLFTTSTHYCEAGSLLTSRQRVLAKGKLLCGNEAAVNVSVKLIDYDTGPNPDDVMDAKLTNALGEFVLDGVEEEFSNIDPYVYIYHDCNDGIIVTCFCKETDSLAWSKKRNSF